jgi:hypothetical protein
MVTAFRIGVVLVLLAMATTSFASACNLNMLKAFQSNCNNKLDADDFGGAAVMCGYAAEQSGICTDEIEGELRWSFLALKARNIELSGAANWNSGSYFHAEGKRLLLKAKEIANNILNSKDATSDVKVMARKTLKDIASFPI